MARHCYVYAPSCFFAVRAFAQSGPIPCAWDRPRAGTVRSALYIDGGLPYTNTWSGSGWERQGSPYATAAPGGKLQKFNYSTPFQSDQTHPVNLLNLTQLLDLTGGGSYDAPTYYDGAMFTSSYELYTYGYGALPCQGKDWTDDVLVVFHSPTKSRAQLFSTTTYFPLMARPCSKRAPTQIMPYLTMFPNHITHGAGASVPTENLAFYFSGKHAADYAPLNASNSATEAVDTMLKVDMSSPGTGVMAKSPTAVGSCSTW